MRSLGVDIGSTNLKVAVVDLDSTAGMHPVHSCRVLTAPTPSTGDDLIDTALRLIRSATDGADVDCVGIASMAETGVPLAADDRPLGALVRWDSHSGQAGVEALTTTYGAAELFRATGVRPSGKAPLAIWQQLRRTETQRWALMRRWAGTADLLALALTGSLVTDHTLAGRTMAYRLAGPDEAPSGAFDPELLALVGLRPEQLPAVAGLEGPAGHVSASQPAGLRTGTPVVVAGHDHLVGAWAAGVRRPGDVADSIGTAEAVVRVLDRRPDPEAVRQAGMSFVRTVGGDYDALVAGSSSAGAMLAWWTEHVLRPAWPRADPEAALAAAAERSSPAGAFVLPYLRGRQAPAPDPNARPRLVWTDPGADPGADPARLAGALLDGLSLQARWMLTVQAELTASRWHDRTVKVLGSAAAMGSPWLRTKAAVGPAPLAAVVTSEPVATGAALLAAARCGLLDPAATLPSRPVPDPPNPAYDVSYDKFVAAALGDG